MSDMTTTQQFLKIGSPIAISHLQGIEIGTLLSHTNIDFSRRIGQAILLTVQFADGTISSWPEGQISLGETLRARGGSL